MVATRGKGKAHSSPKRSPKHSLMHSPKDDPWAKQIQVFKRQPEPRKRKLENSDDGDDVGDVSSRSREADTRKPKTKTVSIEDMCTEDDESQYSPKSPHEFICSPDRAEFSRTTGSPKSLFGGISSTRTHRDGIKRVEKSYMPENAYWAPAPPVRIRHLSDTPSPGPSYTSRFTKSQNQSPPRTSPRRAFSGVNDKTVLCLQREDGTYYEPRSDDPQSIMWRRIFDAGVRDEELTTDELWRRNNYKQSQGETLAPPRTRRRREISGVSDENVLCLQREDGTYYEPRSDDPQSIMWRRIFDAGVRDEELTTDELWRRNNYKQSQGGNLPPPQTSRRRDPSSVNDKTVLWMECEDGSWYQPRYNSEIAKSWRRVHDANVREEELDIVERSDRKLYRESQAGHARRLMTPDQVETLGIIIRDCLDWEKVDSEMALDKPLWVYKRLLTKLFKDKAEKLQELVDKEKRQDYDYVVVHETYDEPQVPDEVEAAELEEEAFALAKAAAAHRKRLRGKGGR